jgi:hypothetical protein
MLHIVIYISYFALYDLHVKVYIEMYFSDIINLIYCE